MGGAVTLVLGVIAQVLHLGLVLGASLLLAGLRPWLRARFAGMPAPPVLAAFQAQRRLFAKQLVRAEPQAALAAAAPLAALAASLAAAMLVPGFTPALALAPFGDLLVVAGLLALARLAEALLTGGRAVDMTEPALLLALCAAALPGATAWVLAAAALCITAAWRAGAGPVWADGAGSDLAFLELAQSVRRLVFLALLVALVLPAGPGVAGPGWWPGAILLWAAELVALAALLALAEAVLPRATPARSRQALAAAVLLAFGAMLAGLATGGVP